MIPGLSGSMLSHDALLADGADGNAAGDEPGARHTLARKQSLVTRTAGPAWGARKVFDEVAVPLCEVLGFQAVPTIAAHGYVHGHLLSRGRVVAILVASGWGQDPGAAWRESVRMGIAAGVRWCFCVNGIALRIFDATRTHSRRFAEWDLLRLATEPGTFNVAWRLLHASSFGSDTDGALHRAVLQSEQHRTGVRESLQVGVHRALTSLTRAFGAAGGSKRRQAAPATVAFDEALVIVYRVLFLLFAEARGLVPIWHPLFRDSYTIEALRPEIEARGPSSGIWAALQAIARLAHKGCRAGTLRVPPFNGRLFSPAHAPLADALPLDEALVRDALAALTTRQSVRGLQRISYADLGVEHLGGVYERVLDYDVAVTTAGAELVRGQQRKASGSFYTPRSVTEYLVRRTLAPLVDRADPGAILSLRVVDPAMGSGAFLVAACRYLAHAYELALVREGTVSHTDISDVDRAGFRRAIAQSCLYGVDLNPMAVQLARLSLWLATLSGDRPLTFFDHRLRTGNSLVGARLDDVRRGSTLKYRNAAPLPLFEDTALDRAVGTAVTSFTHLRDAGEDTLEQVRAKEALFARLSSADGPLARWKAAADLWCGAWFDPDVRRMGRSTFAELVADRPSLPGNVAETLLGAARDVASRERFFHWTLEFPEVFSSADGQRLPHAGFDAVIGNPPWDVLRTSTGGALTRFSRESGCYHAQGRGHANLYQLFAERSQSILRPGGRLGLVLPSGFLTDHGCARIRRHLLDTTGIDSLTVVDNRDALFPIHRGLKFALVTATTGERTSVLPCRTGVHDAEEFDRLPERGRDPCAVDLTLDLLERISGEQLVIPELPSNGDAALVGRLTLVHPAASDARGWNLRFGRELNATDDKPHFVDAGPGRLPVVEGKQIQPFTVDLAAARQFVEPALARRLLPARGFEAARLAYRDVAAASNRLTLIAAVLPPGAVTTHTLFCLRTPLHEDVQHVLCGLFNSYVANYLVRMRVSTHVTVSIVERLPLPLVLHDGPEFRELLALARHLAESPADAMAAATHQALAAGIYGLTREEFAHVLTTFPLIARHERDRALRIFVDRL